MVAIGGSIQEISIRGRTFSVAADADATRKLGGFENDVQANGDGSARIIQTVVPLSIDGITVTIDDSRADQEFLQSIADGKKFEPTVITFASGAVWECESILTGEFAFSSQNATASLALMGPRSMNQQI